jgi:hypothetical protein
VNWEKVVTLIVVGGISAIIVLDLLSSPNTAPIISQLSNGTVGETNLLVGNYNTRQGYVHNPAA